MRGPIFLPVIILVVLLSCGCSTTPSSRHYLLEALAEQSGAAVKTVLPSRVTVVVGPVRIPAYLDRPQMVTRRGPNQLYLDEYNRWTGSFRDNIANVLTRNLAALLSSGHVVQHPLPTVMAVDHQIVVDVIQFDATPGKSVTLVANWAVMQKERSGGRVVTPKRIERTLAIEATDYAAITAAQSRLLAEFSQAIAEVLQGLPSAAVTE